MGLPTFSSARKRKGGNVRETDNISVIKGVGEKTKGLFAKLGVHTVGELIRLFPRGYQLYERPKPIQELKEGEVATVSGVINGAVKTGGNRFRQVTTICLKDESGSIKVLWFRMPFLKNTLRPGERLIVRGKLVRKREGLLMEHPEMFFPAQTYEKKLDTLQPVYPLTAGLTNNQVMKMMSQALEKIELEQEFLPEDMRMKYKLAEYNYAYRGVHFPKDKEQLFYSRKRLVFEEFLLFILTLRRIRQKNEKMKNSFMFQRQPLLEKFVEDLPFELTGAQKRVWGEIERDMNGAHVMARLIQGDVGSGKTILAVLALFYAGLNGFQGALMAPTEVLAKQHYEGISELLEVHGLNLKVELLTGSMRAKEKRETYERIRNGEASLIIGTHALIQEKVEYKNLALVVTDEQHRFGVKQRETLAAKGREPHILVMSATPIPRTLAIILYGELDISVVDELPKDRLPVKNCVVDTSYRKNSYRFMRQQVEEGRQCYVICPMVEESEAMDAENVTDYAKMLEEEMGDGLRIACLHGKMKQSLKDEIMEAFAKKEIDILVSTTVIEVGINVPNATVMMVENAERFGLAQLHQLRGRVGRGAHQSYCIFMTASKSKETKKRLEILNHSNDGFFIAGEDLKLRGPGDLFGIRQSGLMDFQIADVFQDADVLKLANDAAGEILEKDPELEESEHAMLREKIERYSEGIVLETTL